MSASSSTHCSLDKLFAEPGASLQAGSLMVFRASRAAVLGEAQDAAGSPGSSDAAADAGPAEEPAEAPASFALTTGAADEKEDQTVAEAQESPTQQVGGN